MLHKLTALLWPREGLAPGPRPVYKYKGISASSSESGRSGGGEGSWPGAQHMLSNVFISLALNKSLALRNLSKKELKPPEIPHSRL